MEPFVMEIAGVAVCVYPLFQSTIEYCRPYLINKEPEFYVHMAWGDLEYEQMMLEREAIEQGLKIRKFKGPFLERSTIQRRVADFLVERNTVMFHGSTVAVDGAAYLFTAPCGTGKSTHTRLWREFFGERAIMVNDDMPFLKITPSVVLAYGSPWSGKHGLATNVCVPLKGICLLHRGKENSISRSDSSYFAEIFRQQVHIPEHSLAAEKVFDLVELLGNTVPLWVMHCNKDLNAAEVAYRTMSSVSY